MRTVFKVLPASLILSAPFRALAEDGPSDTARIVSNKKIQEIDQKIRLLAGRINQGVKSGALLRDKEKEFMDVNRTKILDEGQLEKLKAIWKEPARKIHDAKHPSASSSVSTEVK